ncbi:MAG: prepilin-type N-terminal cleavage/methylation domain-containing protein [Patescibacteria group bacterium]
MKKNQQGFTLIELLVVVAIIGLLATLSIVALNNARARARDARRVADVKQIQTALELYYNDLGAYPTAIPTSGTTISTGTTVYMSQIPTPPQPADGDCAAATAYTYSGSATTYTLAYCLGSATGGIPVGVGTATPAGIK